MSALLRASTWTPLGANEFTTSIDMAWGQGKGAFGGLLSAGVVRAMTHVIAHGRAADGGGPVPRTLHVTYCAPAREGPLRTSVTIERQGSLITTATARCTQDDKVVTCATATFVSPTSRPSPRARWADVQMPDVPHVDTLDSLPLPDDMPMLPRFTQFFEYRMCIGALPFSGAEAKLGGWVRVRDPYPANSSADAALIAALIDSSPPAVMPRLDEPRPTASVNLTVDFLAPPEKARADGWFLHASSARVGDGGTTDETQELWSADGTLLASCRQLVAIL